MFIQGTPWHVGNCDKKKIGDNRRHKTYCLYFDDEVRNCRLNNAKCHGSAYCNEYLDWFDDVNKINIYDYYYLLLKNNKNNRVKMRDIKIVPEDKKRDNTLYKYIFTYIKETEEYLADLIQNYPSVNNIRGELYSKFNIDFSDKVIRMALYNSKKIVNNCINCNLKDFLYYCKNPKYIPKFDIYIDDIYDFIKAKAEDYLNFKLDNKNESTFVLKRRLKESLNVFFDILILDEDELIDEALENSKIEGKDKISIYPEKFVDYFSLEYRRKTINIIKDELDKLNSVDFLLKNYILEDDEDRLKDDEILGDSYLSLIFFSSKNLDLINNYRITDVDWINIWKGIINRDDASGKLIGEI